jgi:hypothetical protein
VVEFDPACKAALKVKKLWRWIKHLDPNRLMTEAVAA